MGAKTKEQITKNMKKVKNRDSKIEILLRKELWKRGLRYCKNVNDIFGKPDIVFRGKRIAIFCDSEGWHGFNGEERNIDFKSHQKFWIPKIERNIERDLEVTIQLRDEGWTVLRFWGKEIIKNTSECADIIERAVKNNEQKK